MERADASYNSEKVRYLCLIKATRIYWKYPEADMGNSQRSAIQNYRLRLSERGLSRFDVLGRDADRELIRSVARRLAEGGSEASQLRAAVAQKHSGWVTEERGHPGCASPLATCRC